MSVQGEAAAAAGDDDGVDFEAQARDQGWKPKEEYKGKNWVEAKEFVERGSVPVLRERLRQAEDRLAVVPELEARLKEVQDVLGEYAENNRTLAQRQYAKARTDILGEMRDAAKEGDETAFVAGQQKLDALEAEAPPKPAAKKPDENIADKGPKVSATAKSWIDSPANRWFHTNARMNAFATAAHGDNMRDGMSEGDSLRAVSKEVEEKFPEYFENPARRAASSAGTPTNRSPLPPKKKEKTYDDLPAAAKAACDKYVRTIPKFTREQYVAEYDWSGANDEE